MRIELSDDRPRLEIELSDGARALLSPLAVDDRMLLVEGLSELSPESVYSRFGQGRGSLTEAELDYLADVDLRDHVAWGVAIEGDGAGVGRYIVVEDRSCAELAVTVLDQFQRRGLGTLLFRALTAVARADGIDEFCFEFVPDNLPVQRIVRGLDLVLDDSGTALLGRVSLAEIPQSELDADFVRVIEEARATVPGSTPPSHRGRGIES